MTGAAHWDGVYERLGPAGVSWYQPVPRTSLELIGAAGPVAGEAVVDVGGGASPLAGELLARGASDVSVLDLSAVALARSRERLGDAGSRVRWIHGDVLSWTPDRPYGVWHDRAFLHFLVDPSDRERYRRVLRAALRPGGHAVIGAFAPDGPERCSGLPVARYDPEGLAAALGPGAELVRSAREEHRTPSGAVQSFTWALVRPA